jgi:DNA polymerase-3 subunit gamma/tau
VVRILCLPSGARLSVNHRVLSLKYRPQDFDELTGQSHVVLSLKGAIKSGRIGHAFLFAGPRGVGKTTTARIFAKSLNCIEGPTIHPCQKCQSCKEITLSRSIDVVEIDGASNRGIEEIRNLREAVQYSPLHSQRKIYIIDEVHMLTTEAFNALLKTLEEPPPQVVFIFATTNPIKVPQTILSRCERFAFKRLSVKEIIARLQAIAEKEKISITEKALHYIATRSDGSVRDGESIMEQLGSFVDGTITEEEVFKLIGFLSNEFYHELVLNIIDQKHADVLCTLNRGIEEGADPLEIYRGLVDYIRTALLVSSKLPLALLDVSADEIREIEAIGMDRQRIMAMLDLLLRSEELVRRSMNARVGVELVLLQLIGSRSTGSEDADNTQRSDTKQEIFKSLQAQSPKLAALVHNSEITVQGKNVSIMVENDFTQQQLLQGKKVLEAAIREVLHQEPDLKVVVGEKPKQGNSLEDTIRVLFDGEEVR